MHIPIGEYKEELSTSAHHYISMPIQVFTDLCAYVDHYDTEVSGCGMVERVEHRFKAEDKDEPDTVEVEFRITDVYLPGKQDNSKATTNIDDDVVAELMTTLLSKGKDTQHLRLHWHSHADMDTFHSGTDEDNYKTLSNGDFLVSLVINKAHKFLGRIDYFTPLRVSISGIQVYIVADVDGKVSKEAEDSIKALDKYIEEDKRRFTPTSSMYVYDNKYDAKEWEAAMAQQRDLNAQIAETLHVPKELALKFENCTSYNCGRCKHTEMCQEYLYHTDNSF
jgi:hypothetical protein